jgi:Na+/melibiose symporter-like transporter
LLWVSVLLGGAATYLLMSPAAAVMSAYFPVASDLSKTGTGGNPHGLAMFVGTVLVFVLGLPPGLIIAICFRVFESPGLTVTSMLIWTLIAGVISIPLLKFGARALSARKENLVLVAQGR